MKGKKLVRKLQTTVWQAFVAFAVTFFIIFFIGEGIHTWKLSKAASVPVWLNDTAQLQERIPLFASVEKAQWIVVIDDDNSGRGLPAPSPYATIGFAQVDEIAMESLVKMSVASIKPIKKISFFDLTSDATTGLTASRDISPEEKTVLQYIRMQGEVFGISREKIAWERGDEAARVIFQSTPYMSGEIFFDRRLRIVYFRLVRD